MPKFAVRPNTEVYPNITSDHYLEIVEGDFTGLHFVLGRIEFAGEDEEGNGKIEFDYTLLLVPAGVNVEERKNDIEAVISQVLNAIIEKMVENAKNGESNETGNDDTQQPTEG
jgi:hypothetical protein